jgi:hypothetical protein
MYDLLRTYELPSVVCLGSKLISMLIVSQDFCQEYCPLSPTLHLSLWKVSVPHDKIRLSPSHGKGERLSITSSTT